MKNILLAITLATSFSLATMASSNYSVKTIIDCEHCAKDHKCDDKCKKGEKSECCDKAKTAKAESSEKAIPACCAKGKKTCSPAEKKENNETEEKTDKS